MSTETSVTFGQNIYIILVKSMKIRDDELNFAGYHFVLDKNYMISIIG